MTDNRFDYPDTQPGSYGVEDTNFGGQTGQMPPSATTPIGHHGASSKAQKTNDSRSFLFGFLGALLACVIAFGGFFVFNNFNFGGGSSGGSTSATTSTGQSVTLGSSNPSVINASDDSSLAEEVAAKALPSVVAVYNYQYASSGRSAYGTQTSSEPVAAGMGSGVVISTDGYIITNYHVVDGAAKLTVTVDGAERDAEYVGGDESSDVAVIKVSDTSGLVAADIGDSDNLTIGEFVMTVGAPLGLEQSVATGVVSATNRSTIMQDESTTNGYASTSSGSYTYYPNMIQTDAVINPGNSGGALVDKNGKLIGINSMLSSSSGNYAGVGFAIPVNYAMGIAKEIIAGKTPSHAALGVTVSSVNSQTAQRNNLKVDKGAYVSSVVDGSGAASAGIKEGDIITAINGKAIESATDVTLDVREHAVGDTIKVTVNRNGQTMDFDVKLVADTSISSSTDSSSGSTQNSTPQSGSNGSSGGNSGYTDEEMQYILRMLQMYGM